MFPYTRYHVLKLIRWEKHFNINISVDFLNFFNRFSKDFVIDINALFWLWNKFMYVIELLIYCSTARITLPYLCTMYSAFQPLMIS